MPWFSLISFWFLNTSISLSLLISALTLTFTFMIFDLNFMFYLTESLFNFKRCIVRAPIAMLPASVMSSRDLAGRAAVVQARENRSDGTPAVDVGAFGANLSQKQRC